MVFGKVVLSIMSKYSEDVRNTSVGERGSANRFFVLKLKYNIA
jgi:hypothetical protein